MSSSQRSQDIDRIPREPIERRISFPQKVRLEIWVAHKSSCACQSTYHHIPFSFLSSQVSAIVGREHLSASRYLNLQGLKVPGGTQQNCRTQVPAQPYAPKSTLHIKCSILRPPKYLPTHLGSNSINVGRSSKIALTNVKLFDNQFTSFKSPKELLSKTSPVT